MRDLRRYARQTSTRLLIGGVLVVFFVGEGLIYYFYGQAAALMGVLCMGAGLLPVILIILVLWIMDWIVQRGRQ
jgi:hypothetical protein